MRFSYSDAWLEGVPGAFPLDPELPLYPGDQFPGDKRGVFGIFRDTSPDRWGRVLMEREGWQSIARSIGIQRREIQRLETVIDPANGA